MALVQRFDVGRLDRTKRTGAGGARMPASIARTGIQRYRRDDGTEVREYRAPDQVFDAASLETLGGVPVTVGHHGAVTADNWRRLAVGHVTEATPARRADGGHEWLEAPVVISDAAALQRIESGDLVEVSAGYVAEVVPRAGVTPDGEHYDAVQTQIRFNHLALLPSGQARAGSGARLRLDGNQDMTLRQDDAATPAAPRQRVKVDGIDVEYGSEVHVQMLERSNAAAVTRADAAEVARKAGETALGELKAQLAASQTELGALKARDVNALVQDELDFRSRVLPALAKGYSFVGKTRDQVRADALGEVVMKDVNALPEGERVGYANAMLKIKLDAVAAGGQPLNVPAPIAGAEKTDAAPRKSGVQRHADAFAASFGGTK